MAVDTETVFAIQRAGERAFFDHGWLKTYHSFSFAEYYDANNVNWGALRVFNDDTVDGGQGFPPHPHRDMEIVTYVLEGRLAHKDSMGNAGIVGPGGVQFMSAGTGVRHSEFNESAGEPLHFLQMWVLPGRMGEAPSYGQMDFSADARHGRWLPVASGEARVDAPIRITQAATFSVARADGALPRYAFASGRAGFLFLASGQATANGQALAAGDAVRIFNVPSLEVTGNGELVLWDLPLV